MCVCLFKTKYQDILDHVLTSQGNEVQGKCYGILAHPRSQDCDSPLFAV